MKWQQREYSPQQMQQMQQEALERVPPADPHPTSSYHPQPQTQPLSSADANGGSLLDFLPLERDQLLILGLLWLLYSDHCTDNTLMLALLYLFL